jgi:predicted dithiol-disulfide oxidoreductase (DUF899 family)
MDHADGALAHLAQRAVSFAAVSRAPLSKIEEFKKRIGLAICLVSSFAPNFNYDYHISFTKEELPKARYSTTSTSWNPQRGSARNQRLLQGQECHPLPHLFRLCPRDRNIVNTYNYLDLVPKGRDEDGLPFTMSWVRHHARYADGYLADADKP